jgi:hypothetical protein
MSLGSIPARGSFCDRRLLLVRDPLGLLGEPEPFAPEVVIARPKIWTARFMSALQCQVGLSRYHCALDSMQIEHARTKAVPANSACPERAGRWLRYFGGPWAFPTAPNRSGVKGPRPPVPLRGGVPRALGL